MDNDQIVQELNNRFAEPLPEFYKRRIIFWYDGEGEFKEKIDEIVLEGVKIVTLTDNNMFFVKKLLCADDLESNYLVYAPLYFDKDEDNWLLNVELYGEKFHADLLSNWISNMGLPDTPDIRKKVEYYKKFFNSKERREKLMALGKKITKPEHIDLAVMAVLCGDKNIVRAVLCAEFDDNSDENKIYQSFINYRAKDAFWEGIAQATGYHENEDSDLRKLAIHILLTAATKTISIENLKELEAYISEDHQSWCYTFVSEWLNSNEKLKGILYKMATYVEEAMQLPQRFVELEIEDIEDTEIFPCVDKCILINILKKVNKNISNNTIQENTIRSIVEKRKALAWFAEVAPYYNGLSQIANMQTFLKDHINGFHNTNPKQAWDEYVKDYYKMDIYYRLFHYNFSKMQSGSGTLDNLFKDTADGVENLYFTWFLTDLGENWAKVCAETLEKDGHILGVAQQEDFYNDEVKSYKLKNPKNRVYVIISDALRYEVAAELADRLRREGQCKITLNNCEAIFPTVTKFGMAALLPHDKLSVKVSGTKNLNVLADGKSTNSLRDREKVLQTATKNSVALKYDDPVAGDGIKQKKRSDRQELVKGMDVVYIYHDKIDAAGSDKRVDHLVSSCNEAMNDIKDLVRIIVNDFGGTYIMITADHGFLYTYKPMEEINKANKSTDNSQDIEVDHRYLITHKGANPEYLMPVQFLDGKTDYEAFAARENVRIKKKGGNPKFTHGGISLQEMVVPIIKYHHLRTDSQEYKQNREKIDTKPVTLQIISKSKKISNETFYLDFLQVDPIGDNRAMCTYLLSFKDKDGNKVSDIQRIIADRDSEKPEDRVFRCRFNLKKQKYSTIAKYYLVIETDDDKRQLSLREEFTIDITFDKIDFEFFS